MASSSIDQTSKPNWRKLPGHVMAAIMSRLPAVEILRSAEHVCEEWFEVAIDPLVWRRVEFSVPCDTKAREVVELQCLFFIAISRSCGELVDLNIEFICDDALLDFVTQRSTKIKRLRIARPYQICREGLVKTVVKLPLLEEIELANCSLNCESIEAIGRNCLRLKSFKLTGFDVFLFGALMTEINEAAISIGRSMPGLRQLALKETALDQVGLEAILCGCPHLESLDLRQCHVDISRDAQVWRRCTEQVKNLQRSTLNFNLS